MTFKNCRVPAKNIIGRENFGFMYIMHNFNRERFTGAMQAISFARVCLKESVDYAKSRKTFGKRLADHQIIRHKIAEMSRFG